MSQNKRKVIAIVGGIGSGKSTVREILNEWGYPVLDCDLIAREVADEPEVLSRVAKEFGARFVSGGKLERRRLAEYVFADQMKTDKLNGIFHGEVVRILKSRLEMFDSVVFVEISAAGALPKELVDEVWEVAADREVRTKRVMFRDNIRADQINLVMERQKYEITPDAVIDNNGYIDDLKTRLKELLDKRCGV